MDNGSKLIILGFVLIFTVPISILIIVVHDAPIDKQGERDYLENQFPTCDSLKGIFYDEMYVREKGKWMKNNPMIYEILDDMTKECMENLK